MTDYAVRVVAVFVFRHKIERTGEGYRADVLFKLLAGHTNAVVLDRYRSGIAVKRHVYVPVGLAGLGLPE